MTSRLTLATFLLATVLSGAAPAADTGFVARELVVAGARYRYQVFVPNDYTPNTAWPVVLFLHGAGDGGEDGLRQTRVGLPAQLRAHPERFPMLVVMPQSRADKRWAGAMATQALAALDATIAEFHGDPERVYLTGLSMGGQGVWQLAAAHRDRFAAIAPVCGFLDQYAGREEDRAQVAQSLFGPRSDRYSRFARRLGPMPAWIFHGDADRVVPVEESRAMAQALRKLGGDVRYSEYAGVGHDAWNRAYAEPEFVPWLLSHRRQPR
ncbi:prolyl oligopeptidase family serine peptidase [Arenimonas oryziterrae]|uniref:Peptidase S9 prolyl oligopeptidase catalytic domain-containing protein n=1 Tax=Arenimonas oryziterrae DSM 21050 = YC6267 TaxID=1121015 RepID=A0A091BGT5_9GAMM|nr:prolyl oligopeptidase family serine peptidase [Arenimonas oryziterrae]KFN43585.1 hypothetical protein N789_09935 [Arenimonas oryziterrae DSM 21050 = YC6267]